MRVRPAAVAAAFGLVVAMTGICAAAGTGGASVPPTSFPWMARGNEPGWRLTLDAGKLVFQPMEGGAVEAPLPAPVREADAWVYRVPAKDLTVSLKPKLCRDTMSGMPSPVSVDITRGGRRLKGCGGNPSDLLAGVWHVTRIDGRAVPEKVEVNLNFDVAKAMVSGSSGCNRYFGGFALSGEGLSFKPIAGSMMACEGAANDTEHAFRAALGEVQRFDLDSKGRLQLMSGTRTVIRAERKTSE